MLNLRADEAVREAVVYKNSCGGGAIAATLAACQAYGAGRATLLEHTASHIVGSRFGDESARDTVGYAGIVIEA
jgi:AmmeMemoRadiSam system protein B